MIGEMSKDLRQLCLDFSAFSCFVRMHRVWLDLDTDQDVYDQCGNPEVYVQ